MLDDLRLIYPELPVIRPPGTPFRCGDLVKVAISLPHPAAEGSLRFTLNHDAVDPVFPDNVDLLIIIFPEGFR